MLIDGKQIASHILTDLKKRVLQLNKQDIAPTIAIILIGYEKSSATYIKQKELRAAELGASTEVFRFDLSVTNQKLESLLKKLDQNPKIHGIILQRPMPKNIDTEKLEQFISPRKEIDGFGTNSPYPVPVANAVAIILKDIYKKILPVDNFPDWLKRKQIVVLGKGETAGRPIINHLLSQNLKPEIIDSKTENKETLLKNADIIISATGKGGIIKSENLKKGVILIGVGLSEDESEKIRGDYLETEIENIAGFYTPTPGGVGPVNVACLMQNLIKAAQDSKN